MQKALIVDFRLGSNYAFVIGKSLSPHWLYLPSNNEPIAAVIVYFDVLHLVTERSSHRRWSIMFLKISENSQENTCVEVCTYQLSSRSMRRPDKRRRSHWRCSVKKAVPKNLANFHRKTPLLESLFSKVAANQACKFT